MTRRAWPAVAAAVVTLAALGAGVPAPAPASATAAVAGGQVPPPMHQGTLRISGVPRDGSVVFAAGLSWHAPRLPRGMRLLSFEVGYTWQSCAPGGQHCTAGADSTATPFAARGYVAGHADTGRWLRVTETASEVVETQPSTFTFQVIRRSVSRLAAVAVRAYPRHKPPVTAFVNGTPEWHTASTEEYFQVAAPHSNAADGPAAQWYRIDRGRWRPLPGSRVFYTGKLARGPHQVAVRTSNRAGATEIRFGWLVVPPLRPAPCRSSWSRPCWYPQHLGADHRPMRWDWQIGRVTPLQRTGRRAVDIYDIDGFLTTSAQVRAIRTRWQASTLRHPRTVCYLDPGLGGLPPRRDPGPAFPGRGPRPRVLRLPRGALGRPAPAGRAQAHAPRAHRHVRAEGIRRGGA
jgi:hypothetical protein